MIQERKAEIRKEEHLTPRQIVAILDKYIIGQAEAKKSVAIAIRNRWRRMKTPPEIRKEIVPNNILMIGPTGVGKTEIARRLASIINAPFIKVEATKFTEVGYVGRDVESIIRDLVKIAIALVRAEHSERNRKKAEERVEEKLLDILIPPYYDENGEVVNNNAREKFRARLQNKELETYEVEIEVTEKGPNVHVVGPGMGNEFEGLEDIFQQMMPKKRRKKKMPLKEARKVLLEEEIENLIDHEAIISEAIQRTEELGIVFLDEIDKIAIKDERGGMVSREGVQRDLLPLIEGTIVNTKYGPVKTDHILFIAAGAFHLSKPSDLVPELQGRLPIRVQLKSLTEEDFYHILKYPENAITKQYKEIIKTEGVELEFTDGALREIARVAYEVNQSVENIGARRLYTLMVNLLEDTLFSLPEEKPEEKKVLITEQTVKEKLKSLAGDEDMSRYIL